MPSRYGTTRYLQKPYVGQSADRILDGLHGSRLRSVMFIGIGDGIIAYD